MALPAPTQQAYSFFIGKGLTPQQSAGLVGNLLSESGLDPNSLGDNGSARGIAQWHPDRFAGLTALAAQLGTAVTDLNTQLQYVWQELTTTNSSALAALKAQSTPEGSAQVIGQLYERCAACSDPNSLDVRQRMSNALQVFQGLTPNGSPSPGGSGGLPPTPGSSTPAIDTLQTTSGGGYCVWQIQGKGLPLGSITGINIPGICLWQDGWSRAALGALLLAGGGILVLVGAGTLSSRAVIKSPTIKAVMGVASRVAK